MSRPGQDAMTVRPVSHATPADDLSRPGCDLSNRTTRGTAALVSHWLAGVNLVWGAVFVLPWLAPFFMKIEATWAGQAIYFLYGFLCHQFADRSFFLFGPKASYAAPELLPVLPVGDPRLVMRAFRGTPSLGYKVAWSDRMVAIYGGLLMGGLLFAVVRRRLRSPKLIWPALLLVPMLIDGTTHVVSDFAGLHAGFRYTNAWLATLTQNRLPHTFYVGNALGSFNSWARLISGALAGLAIIWAAYPAFDGYVAWARAAREPQTPGGDDGCAL
jgi:uncharacterized membrane protein